MFANSAIVVFGALRVNFELKLNEKTDDKLPQVKFLNTVTS